MNIPELIRRKRNGEEIPAEELEQLIDGFVDGEVENYQISAFLMAVYHQGMSPDEAAALTRSMINSGDSYDLKSIMRPKVDKHSTGGVGDKLSLILAPLVATTGAVVPMVSGRGLGHTGGTLDKLDSIPGYRWDIDEATFEKQLYKVGCAIIGQTANFVPADKKLYAMRDVTATVESIPLICASILSKKVAAGTDYLVMDVKCGSGAFMETVDSARELAKGLVTIGTALRKRVSALITQMNQPCGIEIGNANEVRESIDLLKGKGPADAREITVRLCMEMLRLAGIEENAAAARQRLEKALDDGTALAKFTEWIVAQGGDPRVIDDYSLLKVSDKRHELKFGRSGYIQKMNVRQIGVAANTLGAGRMKVTDTVDTTVGITCPWKVGDKVTASDFITLIHNDRGLDEAAKMVQNAIVIGDEPVERLPLIIEEFRA
ncbi:thymidine phosphorylase [bacterium]|nr:thymidine phosphorylase [bacterium]